MTKSKISDTALAVMFAIGIWSCNEKDKTAGEIEERRAGTTGNYTDSCNFKLVCDTNGATGIFKFVSTTHGNVVFELPVTFVNAAIINSVCKIQQQNIHKFLLRRKKKPPFLSNQMPFE